MKNEPANPNESLWRRKLCGTERETLRSQPALELEARLTDALAKVPDAPVPSNFTTCLMAAVEAEEKRVIVGWYWNWRNLLPRLAVGTGVLVVAGICIQRYESKSHNMTLAMQVAAAAARQPLPSLDALENLDVIQRMGAAAHADGELLAVLE